MAAAAEREKERVRQERRDRVRQERMDRVRQEGQHTTNTEKKAVPAAFPFVSVGSDQDTAAADWRRRNVIPFPGRPLRPHRTRFWPFDGDSAA